MTRYRSWIDVSPAMLRDFLALLPESVAVIGTERHPLGAMCGTCRLMLLHDVEDWDRRGLVAIVSNSSFSKSMVLELAPKAGALRV